MKKPLRKKQFFFGILAATLLLVLVAGFALSAGQEPASTNQTLPQTTGESNKPGDTTGDTATKTPADTTTNTASTTTNPPAPNPKQKEEAPSKQAETDNSQMTTKPQAKPAVPAPSKNTAVPKPAAANNTKPATPPAESRKPESVTAHCTLSIRCDTVFNNLSLLPEEKQDLLPPDGVVYPTKTLSFTPGETVFDVLKRETKNSGIHLEFVFTPLYNASYIEGMNNLYEFDCGELSGWLYSVNGEFPRSGCSLYSLKDGDAIAWVYSCDLGKDVGGNVNY